MFKAVQFLATLTALPPVVFQPYQRFFFASDKDFQDYCDQVNAYTQENHVLTALLAFYQGQTFSGCEKELVDRQLKSLTNEQRSVLLNLNVSNRKTDLTLTGTPITNVNILAKLDETTADADLQTAIANARIKLASYRLQVLKTLKESDANMTRVDLLPYCFGPQADLFAHYNFSNYSTSHYEHNDEEVFYYAFTHPEVPYVFSGGSVSVGYPVCFTYSLDNDGPKHLEDEIRTDLQSRGVDLNKYPRLITDDKVTKQMSPEAVLMDAGISPMIDRWATLSDAKKSDIKTYLMNHNQWKELPAEFEICFDDVQTPTLKTGHVKLLDRTKKFTMQTSDFFLVVERRENELSSRIETKNVLKDMVMEYNNKKYEEANPMNGHGIRCFPDCNLD